MYVCVRLLGNLLVWLVQWSNLLCHQVKIPCPFGQHCKVLQAEYKKASRIGQVVVDLVDRTFAFQQQDITYL